MGKGEPGGPVGLKVPKEANLLKGGFPPGTTVDELHWFSRRRVHDECTRNNLGLEIGSLKDIVSEYTRCYQPPTLVARSLSNLTDTMENEGSRRIRRCSSNLDGLFGNPPVPLQRHNRREKRHFVELKGLHLEGDMLFDTENGDKFIQHSLVERPELLKRATELKLEGSINTHTENRDKYIPFSKCERTSLIKRDSNLHLEGDRYYAPEYREVYVDFPRERATLIKPRSTLQMDEGPNVDLFTETFSQFVKHAVDNVREKYVGRPSNLKCEGDYCFKPEYSSAFKTHKTDRTSPMRHQSTLKLEGDMFTVPEYREKYTTLPNVKMKAIRHQDTFNPQDYFDPSSAPAYIPSKKSVIPSLVVNPERPSIDLSTDKPMNRSRPTTPRMDPAEFRPSSRLDSTRNSIDNTNKQKPPPFPNHENEMTHKPRRSQTRKNWTRRSGSTSRTSQDKNAEDSSSDHQPLYINYVPEREKKVLRRPESFMGDDGKFKCQPEYRRAYMDYLIREKLPRNLDDEDANNSEIKNSDEQMVDAEIMNHKTKNMNLNEPNNNLKTSPRRASAGSTRSSPRKRSSSPSYKLQVTNVDVPKKGFGRQVENNNEIAAHGKSHMRSVAPSWYNKHLKNKDEIPAAGKKTRQQWPTEPTPDINKSFVVLDRDYTNFGTKTKLQESPWYKHAKY